MLARVGTMPTSAMTIPAIGVSTPAAVMIMFRMPKTLDRLCSSTSSMMRQLKETVTNLDVALSR
ncbi:hypothetical protein D1872_301560 [compost metagenome]